MTQEERQLLLQDLCSRLPYGVKVYAGYDLAMTLRQIDYQCFCECWENEDVKCNSRWMLPYLRPLSSMTKEEKEEFKAFHCVDEWHPEFYQAMCNLPNINNMINWLDKKMFDHRGLIPMGLALPAKEGMYN